MDVSTRADVLGALLEGGFATAFDEVKHPRGYHGRFTIGMGDFIEHKASGTRGIASVREGGRVSLHPRGENLGAGVHHGPASDFKVIKPNDEFGRRGRAPERAAQRAAGTPAKPGPVVARVGSYTIHREVTHTPDAEVGPHQFAVHRADGQHLTSHVLLAAARAAAKRRVDRTTLKDSAAPQVLGALLEGQSKRDRLAS